MSEHTQGPLRVVSRGLSTDWDVEGPNGEDLSGHVRGMFAKEADARLYASAPELLEAAKEMVWQWREAYDQQLIEQMPMVVKHLEDAIAKTEDRS